jgi:hypothetical protein
MTGALIKRLSAQNECSGALVVHIYTAQRMSCVHQSHMSLHDESLLLQVAGFGTMIGY